MGNFIDDDLEKSSSGDSDNEDHNGETKSDNNNDE